MSKGQLSTQFLFCCRCGLLHRLLTASWHMVVPRHLLMWCRPTVRPLALSTWPKSSLHEKNYLPIQQR